MSDDPHFGQPRYCRALPRAEWQEKVQHAANRLANRERELTSYLDDLDAALLLARVRMLYERLEDKERATLLQILARRIIVDVDGEAVPEK